MVMPDSRTLKCHQPSPLAERLMAVVYEQLHQLARARMAQLGDDAV
jgi:hypothetical protein